MDNIFCIGSMTAAQAEHRQSERRVSSAVGEFAILERARLLGALVESVKLQSHYAALLNDYDGGKRVVFASTDEWIARLAALSAAKDSARMNAGFGEAIELTRKAVQP